VGRLSAGENAILDIVRNGKRKKVTVNIGTLPDSGAMELAQNPASAERLSNRLGVLLTDLSDRQRKEVGDGVMVKEVHRGPASMAGLINGDIITMIYGEQINSVAEFEKIVNNLPKNRSVPMRIVRRGTAMFIPLRITD
jgi:serine protease Do